MPRIADYPIAPWILDRHSPRAFSTQAVERQDLMTLFEAARWAPSSYNNQPWRFVYALQGSPAFTAWCNAMVPFNQAWASKASVLVVMIGYKLFSYNKKPSRTYAFDTGAAWENFALQAFLNGLIAHGMEGFDYDALAHLIGLPPEYEIFCLVAVGYPGDPQALPADLQKKDAELSQRKPLTELVCEDRFCL